MDRVPGRRAVGDRQLRNVVIIQIQQRENHFLRLVRIAVIRIDDDPACQRLVHVVEAQIGRIHQKNLIDRREGRGFCDHTRFLHFLSQLVRRRNFAAFFRSVTSGKDFGIVSCGNRNSVGARRIRADRIVSVISGDAAVRIQRPAEVLGVVLQILADPGDEADAVLVFNGFAGLFVDLIFKIVARQSVFPGLQFVDDDARQIRSVRDDIVKPDIFSGDRINAECFVGSDAVRPAQIDVFADGK